MQSYAIIPLVALFIYTFLFSICIAAKKTKLIRSFTFLLFSLMLWSGGSFLMRIQFLNAIAVWYHLSLIGIWMASLVLDQFLCHFTEKKITYLEVLIRWVVIAILVVNVFTGWFLDAPMVQSMADGRVLFVYGNYTIGTYIMYGLMGFVGLILLVRLVRDGRNSNITRSQLIPLAIGVLLMLFGNAIILVPAFAGIPLDIVAGVLFALSLFFALYFKHLFSLTLAFSRKSYTLITAAILVLLIAQGIKPLEQWMVLYGGFIAENRLVILSLGTAGVAAIVYLLLQNISDNLFLSDYNSRSESLKEFQEQISKSLNVGDISNLFCSQINKSLKNVDYVRICIQKSDESYEITGSTGILETGSIAFERDNAILEWLRRHRSILTPAEFARSVEYRAMWESEKRAVDALKADYMLPLMDGNTLLGVAFITMKDARRVLRMDEVEFLMSMCTVAAVSIKNSQLYQNAVYEAQIDDMTGLLNRKYFMEVMNQLYTQKPGDMMTLMILSLDDFKLYNQLYGQRVGDEALRKVAEIMRTTVGQKNYVARYSGKEFAVLMPGQEASAARRLGENLRQQIYDMNRESGDSMSSLKILTTSIGICSIPFGAANVKQLVDNTDMAVFQMKQRGKNGVMVYSAGKASKTLETEKIDHKNVYSSYANTIYALSATIDAKDHYTFTHSKNVAYYASMLAVACGLNSDTVEIIREAALLHDIGKIGIPENILNKPGRLTGEEYEIMKKHPENAVAIIRHLPSLDYVIPAVLSHHERWDGKGYPRRLSGEDIPLSARILCVADCFDAITSKRCYQDPRSVERALSILEANSGTQFDPKLVELFVEKVRDKTIVMQIAPYEVADHSDGVLLA